MNSPLSLPLTVTSLLTMTLLLLGCGEPDEAILLDNDHRLSGANHYNATDPAVAICGGGDITITGTVYTPDGSPLEGARVHVGAYRDRFDFDDDFNYRCNGAITRDDGSFELININAQDELLRAVKHIDLGATTFEQYETILEIDLTDGQAFEFDLHSQLNRQADCGDPSGGSLAGAVFHGETTTLPTARVVMLQDDACGTVAGTGGVYELTNIPPGDYNIVFTQGRWRGMQSVTIEADQAQELNLHISVD